MKYIIDLPEDFAEATKEYWDKTVGLQLEPCIEPDRKTIEDEVWKFLVFLIDEMNSDERYECFHLSSPYGILPIKRFKSSPEIPSCNFFCI